MQQKEGENEEGEGIIVKDPFFFYAKCIPFVIPALVIIGITIQLIILLALITLESYAFYLFKPRPQDKKKQEIEELSLRKTFKYSIMNTVIIFLLLGLTLL